MIRKTWLIFFILFIGQRHMIAQDKFQETIINLIDSDFSFYISVKVTDNNRLSNLVLPWDRLFFVLESADTALTQKTIKTNLKKSLKTDFTFALDTATFSRLTKEFLFRSDICDMNESPKIILNKYFDTNGFIKTDIDAPTRSCVIKKLFTYQILVFQDDITGYYRLEKDANKKAN